ncbi:hypothetical protein CYMTET_50099 [Cymbomonas tetramitiformis]|uniref:Uncharacterized protein n=1 Tax=Cymbomonas tetramitiformis TaxID=36881 RepID=A0AAE0BQG6_9CHLO|nr:hypothetical protein CYMTET_50099 [Cymbomonas tetramitiformis]
MLVKKLPQFVQRQKKLLKKLPQFVQRQVAARKKKPGKQPKQQKQPSSSEGTDDGDDEHSSGVDESLYDRGMRLASQKEHLAADYRFEDMTVGSYAVTVAGGEASDKCWFNVMLPDGGKSLPLHFVEVVGQHASRKEITWQFWLPAQSRRTFETVEQLCVAGAFILRLLDPKLGDEWRKEALELKNYPKELQPVLTLEAVVSSSLSALGFDVRYFFFVLKVAKKGIEVDDVEARKVFYQKYARISCKGKFLTGTEFSTYCHRIGFIKDVIESAKARISIANESYVCYAATRMILCYIHSLPENYIKVRDAVRCGAAFTSPKLYGPAYTEAPVKDPTWFEETLSITHTKMGFEENCLNLLWAIQAAAGSQINMAPAVLAASRMMEAKKMPDIIHEITAFGAKAVWEWLELRVKASRREGGMPDALNQTEIFDPDWDPESAVIGFMELKIEHNDLDAAEGIQGAVDFNKCHNKLLEKLLKTLLEFGINVRAVQIFTLLFIIYLLRM